MLVNNISDPWLAHPKASMSLIVNHEMIKCIEIQFKLVGICWRPNTGLTHSVVYFMVHVI